MSSSSAAAASAAPGERRKVAAVRIRVPAGALEEGGAGYALLRDAQYRTAARRARERRAAELARFSGRLVFAPPPPPPPPPPPRPAIAAVDECGPAPGPAEPSSAGLG